MTCYILAHMERDTSRLPLHAELWLDMLRAHFACELANHSIDSEHIIYESSSEATMAMLRQAYTRGAQDATKTPADFEADVAAVEAANATARR